jgi:D-alanine-D-alanine ligase
MQIEIVTAADGIQRDNGFGPFFVCGQIKQAMLYSEHNIQVTVCNDEGDLHEIIKRKPDLVILAVKYIRMDDGRRVWLSTYFDKHRIQYTGSTREAISFDSNKAAAKQKVASNGINTPKFFLALPGDYASEQHLPLPFPLFLKPCEATNGDEMDKHSLVRDFEHFSRRLDLLHRKYFERVLIEEYIEGKEYAVSIINSHGHYSLAAVEVIAPVSGDIRVLSAQVEAVEMESIIPIKKRNTLRKVCDFAISSFFALGARDFGQIEIRTDNHGTCSFLEANLIPCLKKDSGLFLRAFELVTELSHEDVIRNMLSGAIERRLCFGHFSDGRIGHA